MRTLQAILKDFYKFFKNIFSFFSLTSPKTKLLVLILIFVAIGGYFYLTASKTVVPEKFSTILKSVSVRPVSAISNVNKFTTIGKVQAISEANLQTEAGGRVTSVLTTIGGNIRAGSIIATIESSSQRAQLLQAQGAYEAAQAGSAQSTIGVNQADNNLIAATNAATTANRSAFNSVNNIVLESIDQFFSNPRGGIIGVRINSNIDYLKSERLYFRDMLDSWQIAANANLTEENIQAEIQKSRINTKRALAVVDTLQQITKDAKQSDALDGQTLNSYTAGLIANQSTLNGVLASLTGAETTYKTALEARAQARISGGNDTNSAANAQIKIALGSLGAAQANYERTIVRSPISGIVNALYLKTGDYVSPGMPAAIVANNAGLEIIAYVNENDSSKLKIGDLATIGNSATGTITAMAGAIDPQNGKIEVRISVDENSGLTNGSTVTVDFIQTNTSSSRIKIPLAALKITASGPTVFTVNATGSLVALPVTTGALDGESVEILSGISKDTSIVTDARGLSDGQKVIVK